MQGKQHKPWRLFYSTRERARQLRQEMTSTEILLWERLRSRWLSGLKFRRQHPLGRFILDFYCPEKSVAIELDGKVHERQADYDQTRSEFLAERQIRVLRLPSDLVLDDVEEALRLIQMFCEQEA